jgi:hypothetical protein
MNGKEDFHILHKGEKQYEVRLLLELNYCFRRSYRHLARIVIDVIGRDNLFVAFDKKLGRYWVHVLPDFVFMESTYNDLFNEEIL